MSAAMKLLTNLFRRGPDPADNYTPRAQKLLMLARRQADRLHHGYVGTEHLLLGLIELREGVGFSVLQSLGVDAEKLTRAIEAQSPAGKETPIAPTIPATPAMRKVLKLARNEALRLTHNYVGTEHILLGLIAQRSAIAPRVLKDYGVDLEKVRLVVTRIQHSDGTPNTKA